MKLKFNKYFIKILTFFIIFMCVNLQASDKKVSKNIQELLNEDHEIKGLFLEDGSWYINLQKKPSFQLDDSGEIIRKSIIKFISCKYNEIETICYIP